MSYESWLSETVTYDLTKKKNNSNSKNINNYALINCARQIYIIYMLQAALLYFQNLANNYFSEAIPTDFSVTFKVILSLSDRFKIFINDWL